MSQETIETRIARLETLVSDMAHSEKRQVELATMLLERILETTNGNLLTLRLVLAAELIKNPDIRQALTDAIAKTESRCDQIAASLLKIRFRPAPPSEPKVNEPSA